MLPIDEADKRVALQIARRNLIAFIKEGRTHSHDADTPGLLQRQGAFVTIRRRDTGELRGCRGETRPSRPLIESIIAQTINAARADARFPPVGLEELPGLTLRISALTPLQPIRLDQVSLGRHGLVVVQGRRSGLLLPEVPHHFGLQTREDFLEAVLRKAGLSLAQFNEGDIALYAFETVAWDDQEEE